MLFRSEANLFSSESQEKKNKDAIDLLKQFVKKISDLKRDYISLSDSFEILKALNKFTTFIIVNIACLSPIRKTSPLIL